MQGHQGSPSSPGSPPGRRCSGPDKGCTSLDSTERLLCSGSWGPDALIETLRPCRNQREGKGELGRARKHIWQLQKPAHNYHIVLKETYAPFREAQARFQYRYNAGEYYLRGRTIGYNCSPAGRTSSEPTLLLFYL